MNTIRFSATALLALSACKKTADTAAVNQAALSRSTHVLSIDPEADFEGASTVQLQLWPAIGGATPLCTLTLDSAHPIAVSQVDESAFAAASETRVLLAIDSTTEHCRDESGRAVSVQDLLVYLEKPPAGTPLMLTRLAAPPPAAKTPATRASASQGVFVPDVEHICQYTDGVRGEEASSCQTTALTIFTSHLYRRFGKSNPPNATSMAAQAGGRRHLATMTGAWNALTSHWLKDHANELILVKNPAEAGSAPLDFIRARIRAGSPVLVRGNFTRAGHWMVAVGYDDEAPCEELNERGEVVVTGKGRLYFSDPAGEWDTRLRGSYFTAAFLGNNATSAAWAPVRDWCGGNLRSCCARGDYVGYCYRHLGPRDGGEVLWGVEFDAIALR